MKFLFLIFIIAGLVGCNDSATVKQPVEDNALNKDTTIKDTTVIHQ